jgi:phage nucleotide-binding protein
MEHLNKSPDKLDRGISFIIYGDPGVGKTTMSTTLPVGETLIINTECGLGPLLGTGHLVFNVRAATLNVGLEKVMSDIYRMIRTKELPGIKNVVVDNVSELVDQLTIHYTDTRKKEFPELRERGDTAYKMMEWFHNWRDLVDMGINVIFNAWEYPYEIQSSEGTVVTKTCPMVGKASCFRVCGLVDVVGHLEVFEKTGKRWVRFGPSKQYLTKSQFRGLENGEPADLPLIINKLKEFDYKRSEK